MAELQKASPWPFVGVGLIACMAFVYGATADNLPGWALAVLYVLWVLLLVAAIRRWTNVRAVLWLALSSVVTWVLALLAVGHQG